ncbi:MAG: hypothetical protein HOV80_11080 [Polyangiaceae bacterium]|nr:hypothetical protein [Polyangiaceae bacterium]
MNMLRITFLTCVCALLLACPADETQTTSGGPPGGETGGHGGAGGQGGAGPEVLTAVGAHAPDRTHVAVSFSGTIDEALLSDPVGFLLVGEDGQPLVVDEVAIDVFAGTVVVTTAPQKLGYSYTLTIALPGVESAQESFTFLAADTVTLWANDVASPTFASIEVVAERAGAGPHGVVYVQQGVTPLVAGDFLAEELSDPIYPTLTGRFGYPDDIDENERVVVLAFDGEGAAFRGYVSEADSLPDATTMALYGVHSNEMEIIYLNAPVADETTIAHELTHLLYRPAHNPLYDFTYHEEGIATCAQHIVYGQVQRAVDSFVDDNFGAIADGISLVNFTPGSYENYALAYLFWTYIASRMGGIDAYEDIFAIEGAPATVDAFLQAELGQSFDEVHRSMWIATKVQAPTGPKGFSGLIDFGGGSPPIAQESDLTLAPFGAVLIAPWADPVDYPGTQGPDIAYFGIDGSGAVDFEAPFETSGGVLLAMNLANSGAAQEVNPPSAGATARFRRSRLAGGSEAPCITSVISQTLHP